MKCFRSTQPDITFFAKRTKLTVYKGTVIVTPTYRGPWVLATVAERLHTVHRSKENEKSHANDML